MTEFSAVRKKLDRERVDERRGLKRERARERER
jgi:hypothetical protein